MTGTSGNNTILSASQYSQKLNSLIRSNETVPYGNANNDHVNSSRQLGQKHYELTNHLGNVMAVITDKITDSTATNSVSDVLPLDSYPKASLYASYDYYPFGMLMPERYYEDQTLMCTPVTKTVYNTYWYPLDQQVITSPSVPGGFTLTSTGTASMSVNSSNQIVVSTSSSSAPKTTTLSYEVSSGIEAFKGVKLSVPVTNSTSNTLNVSLEQLNEDSEWEAFVSTTVASSTSLELEGIPTSNTAVKIVFGGTNAGFKIGPVMQFERHDLLAGTQVVEICNQDDDFKDDYRFGFNGQHKDNEIKNIGNSLDFGARIYDSRLGRFLSLDPLTSKYPNQSPYVFAGNDVIRAIDVAGQEKAIIQGNAITIVGVKVAFTNRPSQEIGGVVYSGGNLPDQCAVDLFNSSYEELNKVTAEQVYSLTFERNVVTGEIKRAIDSKTGKNENYTLKYDMTLLVFENEDEMRKSPLYQAAIKEGTFLGYQLYGQDSYYPNEAANKGVNLGTAGASTYGKQFSNDRATLIGKSTQQQGTTNTHENGHAMGLSHIEQGDIEVDVQGGYNAVGHMKGQHGPEPNKQEAPSNGMLIRMLNSMTIEEKKP